VALSLRKPDRRLSETAADMPGTPSRLRSIALRAALGGRTALERADQLVASVSPKDRPGLVVFVAHCVFANPAEVDSGLLDPHERATPQALSRLIAYFRDRGYRFVSAAEVDRGLEPGGRYAHLTFDDGFANNLLLPELLAGEGAHATVFPSINHVREGTGYWWNIVYRERHRRGQAAAVPAEYARLRRMTNPEIEAYLSAEFGARSLEPAGEVDRPLTVTELRALAASPWIEVGNHTLDHAVLTHYSPSEAEAQIAGAQRWLADELGSTPFFIAYPNGNANPAVVAAAQRQGLRLGATVSPARNPLPASPLTRMLLGRFRIVFDSRERLRMRAVRSDVQLAALGRRLALRG
jgi:peptidoglycan/xylan/chitin deacetylase (PgdA/CDA1 family)